MSVSVYRLIGCCALRVVDGLNGGASIEVLVGWSLKDMKSFVMIGGQFGNEKQGDSC